MPECGELVQAGDLAEQWTKEFSVTVTANMLGRIANSNGLKTEEYGIEAMDKSPYNTKEVPSFRYNQKGVAKLKALAAAHYMMPDNTHGKELIEYAAELCREVNKEDKTLKINRLCTDGTRNACSKLYGACVRIAREMGYESV